jgi:integrase
MSLQLFPPKEGRTPFYRVRGRYLGVRVNRSTQTSDRALAKRLRDQWKRDIEAGVYVDPKAPVALGDPIEETFASAALAYMQAGGDRRPIAKLLKHFTTTPLADIDQGVIDRAALAIFPDATPATRNREVYTPVSALLKHARVDFKIRRPKGSRGKVVFDWIRPEQAQRLFEAADAINVEFGLLLRFLCYTGCRISEALALTCNDVAIAESFAHVRTSKNGRPRAVHLPPVLVAALASHPRGLNRKDKRLFRFHQGGALRYLLNCAKLVACGLEKPARVKRGKTPPLPPHELSFVTFHTFCHTWATWMRRYAGLDTKGLVGTGRWANEQSASRYQHVVVSEESRRADLLPELGAKVVRKKSVLD